MTDPLDMETFTAHLRLSDPDRHLTARLAPKPAQPALTTLYAFNAELARICDAVSEPALGEIRLQWWRDALDGADESARTGAPLTDALTQTAHTRGLPKPLLLGMVDARSADLDGGGFADTQALKAYLYKVDGALFALSVHILAGAGAGAAKAANAAGVAYGMARLLRTLPRDAAAGRVMLPLATLNEHGVLPEQILAGEDSDGVGSLIAEMAQTARDSLDEARQHMADVPKAGRRAFAPLVLVEPYLRAVTRSDHRPLQEIADINPMSRFLRLWRAARTGRI